MPRTPATTLRWRLEPDLLPRLDGAFRTGPPMTFTVEVSGVVRIGGSLTKTGSGGCSCSSDGGGGGYTGGGRAICSKTSLWYFCG